MAGIFQNGVWSWGFDFTTSAAQVFTTPPGASTISSGNARFAAQSGAVSNGISFTANNWGQMGLGTQLATMISGVALNINALPSVNFINLYTYMDTTTNTPQLSLTCDSGGVLRFKTNAGFGYNNAGTNVGPASTLLLTPNTWYFIETKVTIDNTNGFVECRVNGNTSPVITASNVDTQQSANAFTDAVRIGNGGFSGGSTPTMLFDDWNLLDTTGTSPLNTYIGDRKIITFLPSADSATGGYNTFSTSPSQSAGNHYLNVNEDPPDDATSYNFSASAGAKESYQHANLVAANSIAYVNAWARIEKDDASARTVAITARNGSTDVTGTSINTPTSWTYFNNPFTTDPNTSAAWGQSGFNTSEFGLTVVS